MGIKDRLSHAWNVFRNPEAQRTYGEVGMGGLLGRRPDRRPMSPGNARSLVAALYNRIALDVSAVNIRHVRLGQNGGYQETIVSKLNSILTIEANLDQTSRDFIQDIVLSMFDEGSVAVVPVETNTDISTGTFDILSARVGKIKEWYPSMVRVELYNEKTGLHEDVVVPKRGCAIINNPLYAVMNASNSTMQRLVRKLNQLDAIDEQSGSGKLDLIIQLPYIVKSAARKQQAEERRKSIEDQLTSSKYGVAYTDGTEKVTQLNRPVENNLMKQVEYLTTMLYSQLGLTEKVFNGDADEKELLNYFNRTIAPCLYAIVDEFRRKFLTKTARAQGQSVEFFRDPFKLTTMTDLSEMADKFTRNEILTSNEVRSIIGFEPSADPGADELRNKNLNPKTEGAPADEGNIEEDQNGEETNN